MRIGINGRFLCAPTTGVQRFAREVTRRLTARAEVVVLAPAGAPTDTLDVDVVGGALAGVPWEQLELPRAARVAGVDVVLNPANAAPTWGGPHVVVVHDVGPIESAQAFTAPYRVWSRVGHLGAARRAAAVASVSRWSADRVAEALGWPGDRVAVVAQGAAPLDRAPSADEVAAARARFGVHAPYALAVVAGDPRKGLDFLHDVWRDWSDDDRPGLVVVGRGRGRALAAGRGQPPRDVRHVGAVDDDALRGLLGGAVALLHPSRYEGFGRPPLEAMASGTPAVVGPYGPAREVVGDAAPVEPLEVERWRQVVRVLVREGVAERAARVEAGRRRAVTHRWEDGVDTILSLCVRAVEGA